MINGNSGNDKLVECFGTDTLDGDSSKDDCDMMLMMFKLFFAN